jgi:hypothetical protein
VSKFEYESFVGGYDECAVSKEKFTKEEAIEIFKKEYCYQDASKYPYIAIGNAYAKHRAGRNEDGDCVVGWWLEYADNGRNCPVWCFHSAKTTEEYFCKDYEYILLQEVDK